MKTKTFFLLVMLTGVTAFVKAQTAAYICSETGAYGYAYGSADAATRAYNACIGYGGKYPMTVLNTYSKGYGAIAVGTDAYGRNVIGVSAGYGNAEDAKTRAKNECINRGGGNVYLKDWWYDR